MYKKSIGTRLLAYIIDSIMIYVVAGIMYLIFGFGTLTQSKFGFNYDLNLFEFMLVSFIYFLSLALIAKGKTVGKLITRLEIRHNNLDEVSLKKIVLREAFKSLFAIISLISFIFVLVREDKKSLHDLIVDTVVLRRVKRTEFIEEIQAQPIKHEDDIDLSEQNNN